MASSGRSRPDLLVLQMLAETGGGPITAAEQAAAAESSFTPVPGALLIPIERIAPNPDNPRKSFEGVEDLAASIADRGLLQPLVVRRDPQRPGYYLTIAGARRLLAALMVYGGADVAGRQRAASLPCVVADEVDADAFADALAENMARQDLSRAETMEAVLRLHRQYGWSSRAIARRTGRNDSDISILLRVGQDEQVANLVRDEVIAPTTAGAIQRLPANLRPGIIAGVHAGRVRTGADVRHAARRAGLAGVVEPSAPLPDAPGIKVRVVRDITHPDSADTGGSTVGPPKAAPAAHAGPEADLGVPAADGDLVDLEGLAIIRLGRGGNRWASRLEVVRTLRDDLERLGPA